MTNFAVAGFVLAIVGVMLGLSPAKEWLKMGIPWIWSDYWFPTGITHSSHRATNPEDVEPGRGSGRQRNPTSNEPADAKVLRQAIEDHGDLRAEYDRLWADNRALRDNLNAVSIELRKLNSNGRDRVAANSDQGTQNLPESSAP